jgi:hypothetical protein
MNVKKNKRTNPTRVLAVVVECRRSHIGVDAPCGLAQAMHGIVDA